MQKKQFRVYQSPKKDISNHFQLQTIIKKNSKTLKGLQCKEISSFDSSVNRHISESPNLGSLAKLMKKNKSISSVHIQIEKSRLTNFQRIFLCLKSLQSLSTLYLHSPKNRFIIHRIYQSFTLCTKSLKNLTNLNYSLYDSVKVTSPRRALHYIVPFRLLSHISLKLYFVDWLTDLTWSSFSYHLPSFTSLTSLNLTLDFRGVFTEKSAFYLFSAFKRLPLLTSLDLTPGNCGSSEFAVLRFLFENLKDLSHFQDLTLCLQSCKNLKSDGHELLATGLALLKPSSFRKLSLEFYRDFSDSDLSELLVVIQRFSLLTNLSLKFSNDDQVISKGLSGLPVTLSQFPALQGLDLTISSTINTESFFEILCLCLENLKELISFKIFTWNSKEVDNLGVQRLCSQLPSLPKLQYIDLALGPASRLDEKCIESISQALRDLPGLKSLALDWRSDEKITDKAYEGLIESVGCLKHLRELSLELPVTVNKEMLEALGASIRPIASLNNIFLYFQYVEDKEEEEYDEGYGYTENEIIENYCDDFISGLESMEALTEIFIFLEGFRFSKKTRKIVSKSLKNFRLCD